MQIRPAAQDDLQACLEIYNHYVEHSVATFDTQPMIGSAAQRWYDSHQHPAHPLLLAEARGRVLGYGCLSRWSIKAGYDATAEVSVFVSPDQQRRGIGAALLEALLGAAVFEICWHESRRRIPPVSVCSRGLGFAPWASCMKRVSSSAAGWMLRSWNI